MLGHKGAGARQLGWSGQGVAGRVGGQGWLARQGWRAGPGWGLGPDRGGWGTCVFLHKNVRRNRLEYRFRAEWRGKSCIFYQIFPERYRIFPSFSRIFSQHYALQPLPLGVDRIVLEKVKAIAITYYDFAQARQSLRLLQAPGRVQ